MTGSSTKICKTTVVTVWIAMSSITKGTFNSQKSASIRDPAESMSLESNKLERKIELERRKLAHLENAVNAAEKRLMTARKNIGGVYRQSGNERAVARQRKKLEGELANANSKLNTTIAKNESMCIEISNLRREKVNLNDRCDKLVRKIEQEQTKIQQVLGTTDELSRSHNMITAEMAAMRFTEQEEFANYQQDIRALDQDIALSKSAMSRLSHMSALNPSFYTTSPRNAMSSNAGGGLGDDPEGGDDATMNLGDSVAAGQLSTMSTRMMTDRNLHSSGGQRGTKSEAGRWKNSTLLKRMDMLRKSTKIMQANYDKVKAQTGVADFDEFLNKVEDSGQRAASAYSFANRLSKELRAADQERAELSRMIAIHNERIRAENDRQEQSSAHQASVMSHWMEDSENIKQQLAQRLATVDATKDVLRRIYQSDPQHVNAYKNGMENSDIQHVLSTVEVRVQNILRVYEQIVAPLSGRKEKGGGTRSSKRPLKIKPPGVEDLDDGENDGIDEAAVGMGERDDEHVLPLLGDRLKASMHQFQQKQEKIRSRARKPSSSGPSGQTSTPKLGATRSKPAKSRVNANSFTNVSI